MSEEGGCSPPLSSKLLICKSKWKCNQAASAGPPSERELLHDERKVKAGAVRLHSGAQAQMKINSLARTLQSIKFVNLIFFSFFILFVALTLLTCIYPPFWKQWIELHVCESYKWHKPTLTLQSATQAKMNTNKSFKNKQNKMTRQCYHYSSTLQCDKFSLHKTFLLVLLSIYCAYSSTVKVWRLYLCYVSYLCQGRRCCHKSWVSFSKSHRFLQASTHLVSDSELILTDVKCHIGCRVNASNSDILDGVLMPRLHHHHNKCWGKWGAYKPHKPPRSWAAFCNMLWITLFALCLCTLFVWVG